MRRGKHRKFGREAGQRKVLYRALATALIEHGKIKTTSAKAKSLTVYIAKLITTAKKQDLAARRSVLTQIGEKAAKKLMSEIAPDFASRNGGYTRILRLGQRRSDSAEMVIIEFTK
ncbi:MAG: 50S ribosomal protein L17 [Candidatus Yanofskybacteria bacterium RIFCSPLOWO2_02_FULL_43_10]|uniref:Large ribosomal subunit protein bL17 n=1 Tax=Candidatus Yanofskybacteria bacterium RIFCSPLOWO2_12_FULL_43_11b TaxID=1802710 RepID=A0A1F8H7B1_9BACT|nr:MAG: 50S ribosomal protein L17 [Candidatus Yanofskybacteria bacterium RIFCSPHIGHO2_01_FULL_43_32]OGN11948.1 MAG: 50S ribosomal protein L17 [Candidatus Yanofskybacteria bacterium RIFCSPHIGHO2_02_FULL_43_12]OGN17306.1 MAG: 50S ribosomal protein L17 [Candidatus Yanofskybacteria bacterium RIFCSPHIGHO2_12_FULL_43_11]OGN24359.1 MAG: 50S ribosomal protein L17 [Candidatus Yanofskybacteria bacterium RIFCSPLOWO2_01_FULL_43_46]OGN29432.1 MAG: 50S ribosomal protein L17 [Candidatus Yanofskybacteria bacte